jgi:hypothetical protein
MSAFEDLLSKGAPEPEVHIFLPGKVGAVDKGGDAAQAAGSPAGKPSDSQASSTAPEPEPQLPAGSDPDEPEDPDTFEDDAADAAAAAAAAREMFKVDPAPAPEPDSYDDPVADPTGSAAPASDGGEGDGTEADAAQPVIPRKGGGLTFEGESAYLKQFPRVLIDQMRKILEAQVNEEFARDISQVSIVTAFVMASMGSKITTDDVTSHAVQAFKAVDPRTDAIDKRTVTLLEQQTKSEGMLKALLARLGEVNETTAVLEMGQAYALAERTAQLDTAGALPETLDVTQKRVVAARDNIRRRVKDQRQDEKIRAGRPIR